MFAVLDTNHFREFAHGAASGTKLRENFSKRRADVFSCIVAAEESLQGWIAVIRARRAGLKQLESYARLQQSLEALLRLTILPFDREAAIIFHALEKLRLRVGTMDLKIAPICLAHDATLLTRNLVDFEKVPGLKVENWID